MTTMFTKIEETDARVREMSEKSGLDPKTVAAYLNKEAYRKAYSQRPDVVAKRREYTRSRNEQLKVVAEMLKGL
jgi:hypothetical protein